jgi:hypothetical protein
LKSGDNIVNFAAVITKLNGDRFEVFTNPNADPQSAYKKEHKTVTVDAGTVFQSSAREDLTVGRGVRAHTAACAGRALPPETVRSGSPKAANA